MADGSNAINDGLGVNGQPAHPEPHDSPFLKSFYRTKQVSGSQFPYILSPSQPSSVSALGCLSSPAEWFWSTGTYSQEYYGYFDGAPDRTKFAGGAPLIGTTDWSARACWLGRYTVGPYTGNVVVLQFQEPLYGVIESWALMENVGLVQVEQWINGTPKVKMTATSSFLSQTFLPVIRR